MNDYSGEEKEKEESGNMPELICIRNMRGGIEVKRRENKER